MKTPLLGAAYVARSVNAADNRMVNLFPEVVPEGGKEKAWLQRAPGLRRVLTVGTGPIRGLWAFGGYAYAVSGSALYRIDTAGLETELGEITGTGPVSMSDNGVQLFIAANPDGFIYNSQSQGFAQITDPDFPGALIVGYLDSYFVFIEPQSQRVWVTSLLDGTDIDPLDFASAEGAPDNLVSMIIDHREVWLFGTDSTEVWVNAGGADFPLERVNGAFNEVGCAAAYSVAKADNSVFWLGGDDRGQGIVYRANGYTAVRVSTHAIEWQIQSYGSIADAVGFTYQQDGHMFYVLTFPSAGKTWAYDVAANAWHERAGFSNGEFARHRAINQTAFNNEVWVGDYADGRIYALDLDVFEDDDQPQKWLRSWRALPTGTNTLKRTIQHELKLDCETGVGLSGVDTSVPLEDTDLLTETDVELVTEYSGVTPPFATESSMPALSSSEVQCASNGTVIVALSRSAPTPYFSTSTNGTTWSSWVSAGFTGSTTGTYIGFLNGLFVASGYQGFPNAIRTSTDGVTWAAASTIAGWGTTLQDMAYGNGVWVAVGGNTCAVSSDNWATYANQTLPAGFSPNRICFTGTHFVAVEAAGRAARSTTGLAGSWTVGAYITGGASSDWVGGAFGAGVVFARRNNGGTSGAVSSDNGATWTAVTVPSQGGVLRITFTAGYFCMAGQSAANTFVYSATGLTGSWSSVAGTSLIYTGISPFGGQVVATGTPGTTTNYSALLDFGFNNPDTTLLLDQKRTQGVIPKVMLRWSDDGGHTWSNEHWREIGRSGAYGTRVEWRRLGMTQKLRDRVYEVSSTDPVKIALMGAELNVKGTDA